MSPSILCSPVPSDAYCWRRVFPGLPYAAAAARRFVTSLLDGHPLLDDVLVAVDELVVNALRHTRSSRPGGRVTVEVRRWPDGTAIVVGDDGGLSDPVSRDAAEHAETGRGLRMIAALADGWGWYGNADGRRVIAVFDRCHAPAPGGLATGAA